MEQLGIIFTPQLLLARGTFDGLSSSTCNHGVFVADDSCTHTICASDQTNCTMRLDVQELSTSRPTISQTIFSESSPVRPAAISCSA